MAVQQTDFESLAEEYPTKKERMTLLLMPEIKEELKRQAKQTGVSPSAYVATIISERAQGWKR